MGSTVFLFAARSLASCFAARSPSSRFEVRLLASRLGLRHLASRLGLRSLAISGLSVRGLVLVLVLSKLNECKAQREIQAHGDQRAP
jgi:hypothetical protein